MKSTVRMLVVPCFAAAAIACMGSGCKKNEAVMVIGGYGWMANFMDQKGFVATDGVYGVKTQYNFGNTLLGQNAAWVQYGAADKDPKPFDCGACHTTGYTAEGEPAAQGYGGSDYCNSCHNLYNPEILTSFPESGHQHALTLLSGKAPDMPFTEISSPPEKFSFGTAKDIGKLAGISGQWVEPNIGCEACHGPSGSHTGKANAPDLAVARASCAKCHSSGEIQNGAVVADGAIETDGNFVNLGQEWEEWLASPHSNKADLSDPAYPGCATCHDAHASTKFDATAAGTGVKIGTNADCTSCHAGKTIGISQMASADVMCIDCHMPYAGKAAFGYPLIGKEGNYAYVGDLRSHQFRIRTDKDKNSYIDLTTKKVKLDESGKTYGLTVDLVCQPCHSVGGLQPHDLPAAKPLGISELQDNPGYARKIHP